MIDKQKLANLTLVQLSVGLEESGEKVIQLIVAPASADYPKRTVMIGLADGQQFAAELEAAAMLIRAHLAANS